jgi:AAA family ATP:ADP antiporter
MVSHSPPAASPLDRGLRLFADVRPGDGLTAVLLALNIFLLLTAYYVLKPVREALILGQGSAELKSYMSAGMVIVLAVVVPLYGRLAARVARRRLINIVTAIFAACLALFYALLQFDVPIGQVFFVWIGVLNMMIVAQFWGFANDLYTKDEGERLFAIVGFGASLGAVLGAVVAGWLIAPLGLAQLLLVGAGLLVAQAALTNYVDTRETARAETQSVEVGTTPDAEEKQPASVGAFGMVFGTPYLLLLGFMLLCLNLVNTTGEYILGSVIEDVARESVAAGTARAGGLTVEEFIGQFYSQFFSVVNVVSLLIQLFLVSRIIKYVGVRFGVMALPCIAMGAYNVLAFFPVLAAVRWAKTAENATDYSLNNTVRNMLFLPCTREQKYGAKQVIDSFFVRIGDVLSAALVFVGTTYFALGGSGFAVVNIVIVSVWLVLAFIIGREYKQLTAVGKAPGPALISGANASK